MFYIVIRMGITEENDGETFHLTMPKFSVDVEFEGVPSPCENKSFFYSIPWTTAKW